MASFPTALGLSAEQTEDVVQQAGLAPSLHNSQPWRFRLSEQVIELHSDPQRRLPAADPDDRELRLACGAALLNLRLALEHFGVRPVVALLPRLAGPTSLAEVRSGGQAKQAPEELALYQAIPKRRSNRRPFLETPVPTTHRHELATAVRREQSSLRVMKRPESGTLEGLVHRAHRAQMADARFRDELARWTGRPEGEFEGVPAAAAGPTPEPQDQWVLRDFSGGQARARVPGKDFEYEPLMVVVCSNHGSRLDDLHAGQAMQRLLLTATALGLASSLLSEVVEVAETRDELRQLLGGELYPQAVVRVGYGSPTPATPRRDLRELLIDD
ncbi:Acg family FMN-binding oxidoreductase [Saccharopolyspora pogona]|uniref:Acg family FMN-binding oxidoreductase n=1 Tax=Saccharopolyspora pogona TaxID=333966 RepID=UPI001686C58E|nr:nitroreductase family protein [Saccharopolyspora pogona]